MGDQMTQDQSAAIFRRSIELAEVAPEHFDRAFLATPQYAPWPKAYGGDAVAQSLAAATATIGDDRAIHSVHGYFLRPVDIDIDVRYEVELVRDGRGYSTRQVRGYQHGKPVFLATASFQVPEVGPSLSAAMPNVPAPESLPSSAEVLDGRTDDASRYWAGGRSFDHRHVPGPLYIGVDGEQVPHQAVWVRAFDRLPDDPKLHRIAIAYVCDYTILESALRGLGLHWSSPGLMTASLDHAMWFHRDARADEWLLYAQEAVSVQSGRGLGLGHFFTESGDLVATVAQEGLIRHA